VNDPPAFVVGTSLVGKSRLDVLGEVRCAWVELAGSPSLACARHAKSKACVAALTKVSQILTRAVGLVAVYVIDDQKAG
jgi:hypothetical protein